MSTLTLEDLKKAREIIERDIDQGIERYDDKEFPSLGSLLVIIATAELALKARDPDEGDIGELRNKLDVLTVGNTYAMSLVDQVIHQVYVHRAGHCLANLNTQSCMKQIEELQQCLATVRKNFERAEKLLQETQDTVRPRLNMLFRSDLQPAAVRTLDKIAAFLAPLKAGA